MPVVLLMYFSERVSQSMELMNDIFDQTETEVRNIAAPELAQISSVRPLQHEISFRPPSDGRYKADDIAMPEFSELLVYLDLVLPHSIQFPLLGLFLGIQMTHLLDGYSTLNLIGVRLWKRKVCPYWDFSPGYKGAFDG